MTSMAMKGYMTTTKIIELLISGQITRAKARNNLIIELHNNQISNSVTKEKIEIEAHFYKLQWEILE